MSSLRMLLMGMVCLFGFARSWGADEPEATPPLSRPAPTRSKLVLEENQRPGTSDWLIKKTATDPKTRYRSPQIEGYASHASIQAGERLTLFVNTQPLTDFQMDVYRLGYYGGLGGRLMKSLGRFAGETQLDPIVGPKRVRNCLWSPTTSFAVPYDWLSGVYLVKLTTQPQGLQSYIIFIVRDERPADMLFQCSDNTWQAYNRWPSQFSLYDDGKSEWYWGDGVGVSYNRPYGKYSQLVDTPLSQGSGEFLLWEFPLAYWLEQKGWDVSYISNLDTHARPRTLDRTSIFLSVGHDEYWTLEMYDHVRTAMANGLNLAFLSGNTCCGRVQILSDQRSFERVDVFGPPDPEMKFVAMKQLPHTSPWAKWLIGAHSVPPVVGGGDWTCQQPDHWLFANTGMKKGDSLKGLIGWEWHGDPSTLIPGLEIVASGPTVSGGKPTGVDYTSTIYPGPRGNWVFNAATIWWSLGLSRPPGFISPTSPVTPSGPTEQCQRITENLLLKMGATPAAP